MDMLFGVFENSSLFPKKFNDNEELQIASSIVSISIKDTPVMDLKVEERIKIDLLLESTVHLHVYGII